MSNEFANKSLQLLTSADKRKFYRRLHTLVRDGNAAEVDALLSLDGFTPQSCDAGNNPLPVSARAGSVAALKRLIEFGFDVDFTDDKLNTLLHIAVEDPANPVVEYLLRHHPSIDVNATNLHGFTALHSCASRAAIDHVRLLIEFDAFVNTECCGDTSLMVAIKNALSLKNDPDQFDSFLQTAELLLRSGADAERWCGSDSALNIAASAESGKPFVALLVKFGGANVDAVDRQRQTALHHAVLNNQFDNVEALINLGASIDAANYRGETALLVAARRGYLPIVRLLVDEGADVNALDREKNCPLHVALVNLLESIARRGPHFFSHFKDLNDVIMLFITKGCDVNLPYGDNALSPLHMAFGTTWEIVEALVENGANLGALSADGESVLHYLMKSGGGVSASPERIEYLVKKGAPILAQTMRTRESALHYAINFRQPVNVLMKMMLLGADINAVSYTGHTPLCAAIEYGQIEAAKLLISTSKTDVNHIINDGVSVLGLVVKHAPFCFTELLLKKRTDLKLNLDAPQLPLNLAIERGVHGLIDELLRRGADPDACDHNGHSALWEAVHANDMPTARKLLVAGACTNALEFVAERGCCRTYHDRHPHMELQPFFQSMTHENDEMFDLLMQAYHRMPYHHLHAFRDMLAFGISADGMSLAKQKVFNSILERYISGEIATLKNSCRRRIRCFFGLNVKEKIEALPVLPSSLKRYLIMADDLELPDVSDLEMD